MIFSKQLCRRVLKLSYGAYHKLVGRVAGSVKGPCCRFIYWEFGRRSNEIAPRSQIHDLIALCFAVLTLSSPRFAADPIELHALTAVEALSSKQNLQL